MTRRRRGSALRCESRSSRRTSGWQCWRQLACLRSWRSRRADGLTGLPRLCISLCWLHRREHVAVDESLWAARRRPDDALRGPEPNPWAGAFGHRFGHPAISGSSGHFGRAKIGLDTEESPDGRGGFRTCDLSRVKSVGPAVGCRRLFSNLAISTFGSFLAPLRLRSVAVCRFRRASRKTGPGIRLPVRLCSRSAYAISSSFTTISVLVAQCMAQESYRHFLGS
jgi:hypothetical protein